DIVEYAIAGSGPARARRAPTDSSGEGDGIRSANSLRQTCVYCRRGLNRDDNIVACSPTRTGGIVGRQGERYSPGKHVAGSGRIDGVGKVWIIERSVSSTPNG